METINKIKLDTSYSIRYPTIIIEMSTLAQVWNDFDVGFKIEENTTQSNTSGRHHPSSYDYNIAHSTGTVLVDHEGNQRIWWGDYDWIIDLVKEDILNLVAEAEETIRQFPVSRNQFPILG